MRKFTFPVEILNKCFWGMEIKKGILRVFRIYDDKIHIHKLLVDGNLLFQDAFWINNQTGLGLNVL